MSTRSDLPDGIYNYVRELDKEVSDPCVSCSMAMLFRIHAIFGFREGREYWVQDYEYIFEDKELERLKNFWPISNIF